MKEGFVLTITYPLCQFALGSGATAVFTLCPPEFIKKNVPWPANPIEIAQPVKGQVWPGKS